MSYVRYSKRTYSETQNSKLKTQNSKLKTQNSKLKTQNSKLKTQNSKLKILWKMIEMAVLEKESKAERIEVRVTPNVKALLTAAAQSRHTTVSDFLLDHGIEAAERAIASPRVFYASEEGWAAVQKLLDEDDQTQPSAATISWLTQPRRKE
jgi:uncharacterized protein (DUF1778 family)